MPLTGPSTPAVRRNSNVPVGCSSPWNWNLMGLPKIALPGCHGDRHASIYSSVFSCLLLLLLLLLTTHKATWEGCLNFCGGFFFFCGWYSGFIFPHWACLCCESHSVLYGDWPGRRFVRCFVWVFIRSIWTGLLPSKASKAAWYLYRYFL